MSCSPSDNQVKLTKPRLLGGSSKVDILIATPGRLMDHLTHTPNFTLQHLRFMVRALLSYSTLLRLTSAR